MKKYIYSVRDNLAECFSRTIDEINDQTAIRAFINSFKDNPNKNDYSFYRIGEWNDATGQITVVEPQKIYSGFDIKLDNITELPQSLTNQNA